MELSFDEAKEFFGLFYCGEHHIPAKIRSWGDGWCINHVGVLSTYDSSNLTRLVFLSHEKRIRVEIGNSGPNRIRIALHKRKEKGRLMERHPGFWEAVDKWNDSYEDKREVF